MTKYGRWEAISSSSGSDSDSGNDEQLRGTKTEIEDDVKKMLKLIKNNDNDGKELNSEENLNKQSELVQLVEGFHRQYKSLYELYDHLKEEVRKKVDNKKEKEVSSSSTSSSDSEYYSPEEVSSKSSKWSEQQEAAESIKQELDNAKLEVTDLKRKLTFTTENEGLHLEYKAAMSKNQELKKMISDLEIEAEQRQNTIQAVKDESDQLKEKLGEREKYLSSSAEMHKVRESEVSAWTKELEGQIAALRLELNSLCTQKRETEQQIESKTIEIKQLREDNSKLQGQVLVLEKLSEGKGKKLSAVAEKLKDHEKTSKSEINDLVAQVNNLQVEVDSLRTQKGELEEELESKRNEASAQVKGLMEQADKERLLKDDQMDKLQDNSFEIKQLGEENSKLQAQVLELEKISKGKGEELSVVAEKLKDHDKTSKSEINDLVAQVNNLQVEVDSVRTQKRELEEELECKRNEASTQVKGLMEQADKERLLKDDQMDKLQDNSFEIKQLGEENSKLQAQVLELEKISKGKGEELSAVAEKLEDHEKISKSEINDLVAQVNNLQEEVDNLRTQKGKLEEELESKRNEGLMEQADKESLLKDDQIDKLQYRIFELEKRLKEKGEECYAHQRKFEKGYSEASARFMSLTAQFKKLKKEFDSLQTEKSHLVSQIAREKQEYSESLIQVKTQNEELTSTIAKQEDTIHKLSKECKQVKGFIQESKVKLQTSERKMIELAEVFCKNIEDNIRLLCQRIQVAEALHTENKEHCRKMLLLGGNNLKSSAMMESKEVEEKSSLTKAVSQLEKKVTGLEKLVKEKEEGMQELGEEKREAIRQLCMLIDYHRSRYDHLKILIPKLTARSRRTS